MYDINKLIGVLEYLKSNNMNYVDFREIGDVLRISGISDTGWLSTLNYDMFGISLVKSNENLDKSK